MIFCCLFFLSFTGKTVLEDEVKAFPEEELESTALKELELYVKELFIEGNLEKLEQFRISRTVEWETADQWAMDSPYFAHFASYPEYQFWSNGVILLQVDLNGDGKEDFMEYLPETGRDLMLIYDYCPDSFVIYLSNEKGDYTITYYHPNFATNCHYNDSVSVIYYQNAYFLIFEKSDFDNYEMEIYQVEEGILTEQLILRWEYGEVLATTLFCTEEQKEMADLFCKEAEQYYRERGNSSLFQGNQEKSVARGSEEHLLLKELEVEANRKENWKWKDRYEETYERSCFFTSGYAVGSSAQMVFQSDLDQDGEMELYAKKVLPFNIKVNGNYYYKTGELYENGKYEGKTGLKYALLKDGNLTNFESLCGLDLWSEDYMPYMFWVEGEEGEVITYVKYYDEYYKKSLLEGYRIKEGSYEKVLSVLYQPELLFTRKYEKKTEEEKENVLTYMVYLQRIAKEKYVVTAYPKIYGLEKDLEKKLNRELEQYIKERDAYSEYLIESYILSATKKQVVFNYIAYGSRRGDILKLNFMVDLETGKIQKLENEEADLYYQEKGW